MAHILLIWDHRNLTIWRQKGERALFLSEATIETRDALLDCLKKNENAWKMTSISLFLDHAELDHHIQRTPPLSKKLHRQLMEQRKEKLYGSVSRSWISSDMELNEQSTQESYFVASLLGTITRDLAAWALRVGISLNGVFSLPMALGYLRAGPSDAAKPVIRYQAINQSIYLLAYNIEGKFLFVNRVLRAGATIEQIESASKRLALFTEQEFGETPGLESPFEIPMPQDVEFIAEMDKSVIEGLINLKLGNKFNLVSPNQIRHQRMRRIKHQAFAVSALVFGACLYFVLPIAQEKRSYTLKVESINADIQSEAIATQKIESDIISNTSLMHLIDFSVDRAPKAESRAIPMVMSLVVGVFSKCLPEGLELDSLDCEMNFEKPCIEVSLTGRPLTPNINLVDTLEKFESALKTQGWKYDNWNLEFSRTRQSQSRFDRRGALRSFNLSLNLLPKP